MARFDSPIDAKTASFLREKGFADGRSRAVGCLGWIWCQWLNAGPEQEIQTRVELFVDRGMEMQDTTTLFYMRPMHDVLLLHCAIFASKGTQLKKLAERVVDASGYKNYTPKNDGELYASAWCGMLKYWILGDLKRAGEQSDLIWDAYRPPSLRASTKSLVSAWAKGDWKSFAKAQVKEFDKLWSRSRKDGTVTSEKRQEITVDIGKLSSIQQLWCWAECGMALLAHRQGVEVTTDPFWFPPHALKAVPKS